MEEHRVKVFALSTGVVSPLHRKDVSVIQEQRRLERKYELLIAKRGGEEPCNVQDKQNREVEEQTTSRVHEV